MTYAPARVASHQRERLVRGWEIRSTPIGLATDPSQLADLGPHSWIEAGQLGTVAAILRDTGEWSLDAAPRRFDGEEWWYRTQVSSPPHDEADDLVLGFDGLATLADVWLNGEVLFSSDNMFIAHEYSVRARLRAGRNELILRFRPLDTALQSRRPRPGWRAPMIENQQLRWFRTTLLGRTPGWSPPVAPVGPWKDIWLERRSLFDVSSLRLSATVEGTDGTVQVMASLVARSGQRIDSVAIELQRDGITHRSLLSRVSCGAYGGALKVSEASLWWPHTHGEPALYEAHLAISIAARSEPVLVDIGRVGFRNVTLDRSGEGFSLHVNGVPIFCRGACWTPLDIVTLRATSDTCRAALQQVRDSGMNMLRVSGTMVYEDDAFFDACDALGVLVWQDFMFANMDYPSDPAFLASVEQEVRQQILRLQARPSLAVLCGNSEVEQQAAMWGAQREHWTPELFHRQIAQWAADLMPAVPYWPSSAHGGAFPYQGNVGTTSYYGVGAYLRPLDDARRAEVCFATECLAFANVPETATLARMPGGESLRVTHPGWKARTPRDLGAGWDFEDVRDHYLETLFRVDPAKLRHTDHERYLALSRVVTGEVMAAIFAEWRRGGSSCNGALVWFLRDLWAGAGWGLLDDKGAAKAAMHCLKRVLQPVNLSITDEGCNGLFVHVVNESAAPLTAKLDIAAYNESAALVAHSQRDIRVDARHSLSMASAELFDGFLDLSAAYRFGPAPAQVVVATLRDTGDRILSEAFHFPSGLSAQREDDIGIAAAVTGRFEGGIELTIHTERFAQNVFIELAGYVADDNYFHLAPRGTRSVRLRGQTGTTPRCGNVQTLNSRRVTSFEVAR